MTQQWCICNKSGTCMGCMIQKLVLQHLGLDGEAYLKQFVAIATLDDRESSYFKYLADHGSTPDLSMSMDMT